MIEEHPGGGVRLRLLIQPKSSKNEIIGPHDGALKVKITAPPVDGQANACLIQFLAKTLKVPQRNILLVKGESGRRKLVEVQGLSLSQIKALLGL